MCYYCPFSKYDMCYNLLVLFYTSDLYGKMMYIELCIMIGVLQAAHGTSTSDSNTSKRAVSHRDEMHKEFLDNTWINIADVKKPMSSIQCSKCCCPVSDADASASESRKCLPADEIHVEAAEGTRPADATSRHRRSLNFGQYIDFIYNGYATSYHDVDFSAHSYSDFHLTLYSPQLFLNILEFFCTWFLPKRQKKFFFKIQPIKSFFLHCAKVRTTGIF